MDDVFVGILYDKLILDSGLLTLYSLLAEEECNA